MIVNTQSYTEQLNTKLPTIKHGKSRIIWDTWEHYLWDYEKLNISEGNYLG